LLEWTLKYNLLVTQKWAWIFKSVLKEEILQNMVTL
jgi:hypothetical protein